MVRLMIVSSVANTLCESLCELLSEIACSKVPTEIVLCFMEAACNVVSLVLWVGQSEGVGTFEKVTLLNSIGHLVVLCISDLLKTTI